LLLHPIELRYQQQRRPHAGLVRLQGLVKVAPRMRLILSTR
jgi:hypothetical protein